MNNSDEKIKDLNRKINELEQYAAIVKQDYKDALKDLDELEEEYQELLKEKHGSIGWQISIYRDALNKIKKHTLNRKQIVVGNNLILSIIRNAFSKTQQGNRK